MHDLDRSINSLLEELATLRAEAQTPKPDPQLQAYVEIIEPTFLLVGQMAQAWNHRFDILIAPIQELIRTCKRALKEAEKHQIQIPGIHYTLPAANVNHGNNAAPDGDSTNPDPATTD